MAQDKSREFAGTLREWIRIERSTDDRDSSGSVSGVFELVGEYHASAEPAGTGVEAVADSRSAMLLWQFQMRLADEILPGDRLTWNNRSLIVRTVTVELRPTPKTCLLAEETL
ncbi:MAG: hypothetical protein AAGE37_02355 [Pseudomonadota bacterium]